MPTAPTQRLIAGRHQVRTVTEAGWTGKSNGELLALASRRFDVLITVDRNLPTRRGGLSRVAVIVLLARSNRIEDIEPLVSELATALKAAKPGQVLRVGHRPHGS